MPIFNPIQDLDPSDTYAKKWNPMKTIQVIVRTPSTHDRAPRFIKKKRKQFGKNTNIENQQIPGLISCVSMRSLKISSLKAVAEKLTSEMPKKVTWPAIMRIFNEVRRSYPTLAREFQGFRVWGKFVFRALELTDTPSNWANQVKVGHALDQSRSVQSRGPERTHQNNEPSWRSSRTDRRLSRQFWDD